MPQHPGRFLERALLRRAQRRKSRRSARRDQETLAQGRRTAAELEETGVVPRERPEDFGRPDVPSFVRERFPDLAPSPAATRLISAGRIRRGETPPLASLETPRQREAAVVGVLGPSGSRTNVEGREEISEQDRRFARFTALGELPEREPGGAPDLVRDIAEIPGVSPILGGAASLGDLLMQPIRAIRGDREALDRFQDRRAEELAVREESTGVLNRARRAVTFGTRVGGEVALIEAALAAAVPSLATAALVGGGLGRVGLRVGAREAVVGAASEGAVALAETEGDVRESARRAAFGGVAGGTLGSLFGRLAGRGARRAATRELEELLAEGAGEAADAASETVVRRLGTGTANAPKVEVGNRTDRLRRVDFREPTPELRPDRLLPRPGDIPPTPAPSRSVQEEIAEALRGQAEAAPTQIPARTGGITPASRRGTGGQVTLGPGFETTLEQAARISRSASDASPRGTTGAAADAIARFEREVAETGRVPDVIPEALEGAVRPGARVPTGAEAPPPPQRIRPEGPAAEAEAVVNRGIERRARELAFEGAERRAGADRRNLPGARVGGELQELQRITREGMAQDVTPSALANPASAAQKAQRSGVLDELTSARVASEPAPKGRAALDPPSDAKKGPGGPVETVIDARTGKAIPDPRTAESRLKRKLTEGPGGQRGGFAVDPRRDVLESGIPKGASRAMRAVLAKINVGGKPARFRLPSLIDLYTDVVDRTAGLKRAGRRLAEGVGELARMDLPQVAARLTAGAERRAESFLQFGGGRWTPEGNWELTGTPGLTQILGTMKGRLQELRTYMVAARAAEVGARGITTGISDDIARAAVREAAPEIRQAGQQITKLLDDALAYYAEASGLPAEQLAALRAAGRSYIPLDRVFEGADPLIGRARGAGQPIQKLEGSEREIIDPLESTVDYIKRLIRAGDDQRTLRTLAELVERNPEKALELGIERVPTKFTSRVDDAAARLVDAAELRGQKLTLDEAREIVEPLLPQVSELSDTFTAWVGGQRLSYRMPPVVAKAFKAMNPQTTGVLAGLAGLLRLPARGLRAGVTLNPIFQIVNGWRDMLTATAQSRFGFNPFTDFPRGFSESARANWFGKASETYQEFVAGGGGFTSLRRGADRRSSQASLEAVIRGGDPTNPVSLLKKFAVPFEEAARIGEYMKARKSGAGVADAVFAAQDVTVNFQQMGASMAGLSMMTAFMNAGIQSLDIMARTLGRAATTQQGAKQFLLWGSGAMAMPSAILWFANRDDQEIQDLRKTPSGSLYWFVRDPFAADGEGGIARIPKPFVWGQLFGTGTEAFLDQLLAEDPEGLERFFNGIVSQVSVGMIPNAFQIPIEQFANTDLFFGSPLTPQELEKLEPRLRVTERTSRVAIKINQLSGGRFPPTDVDAIIRDLGGTLTAEGIRAFDQVLDYMGGAAVTPPALAAGEIAFFNRFIARSPSLGVEPVQTFWEAAIPAQEAIDSYRTLVKQGRETEANDLFERRGVELMAAATYSAAREQIGDVRNGIDGIREMPDDLFAAGTDIRARKRRMIDDLTREYVEIVRLANQAVAQITASAEAREDGPGG